MAVRSKKYLRALRDTGYMAEFISYLIEQNSIVVNEYARKFCKKNHIKAPGSFDNDQEYLERCIDIVHTKVPWIKY